MSIPQLNKEEINSYPLVEFPGQVQVITDAKKVPMAIEELMKSPEVGFDTETRPSFKKGQYFQVSLLQLSTKDKAYLFRLRETGLTQEIVDFFENQKVKKIGLAIHDDIKGLQKINNFDPNSFVELQSMAEELKIKTLGLRNLVAIFFRQRLSKRAKLTNWDNDKLTKAQIQYAATDAWISRELYFKLKEHQ